VVVGIGSICGKGAAIDLADSVPGSTVSVDEDRILSCIPSIAWVELNGEFDVFRGRNSLLS
jgi:hypothetical protein